MHNLTISTVHYNIPYNICCHFLSPYLQFRIEQNGELLSLQPCEVDTVELIGELPHLIHVLVKDHISTPFALTLEYKR